MSLARVDASVFTSIGIDDLVDRAEALLPWLREQQGACEQRGHPSREVYEAFKEAGFFRVVTPKIFGGYELSLRDYYQLVMAIARGCPSTGWWYALGAAHAVQISSYCQPETQRAVFAFDPDFSGPWTFNSSNIALAAVEGGYRISGTWHFCSGGPHASFLMAGLRCDVPGFEPGSKVTALVPRGHFTVLDDWGDMLGVRGSGSNSIRIDNVFVPAAMVFEADSKPEAYGPTPGSALHGNPLYGGLFRAFAEGGLAAVATGTARAAIDEYVAMITTKTSPHKGKLLRADDPNFQRTLGLAIATVDSVEAITLQGAELFLHHADRAVRRVEPFDQVKARSMDGHVSSGREACPPGCRPACAEFQFDSFPGRPEDAAVLSGHADLYQPRRLFRISGG